VARMLAHPFRVSANGTAATVEQNSDDGNAQELAVLILTRTGERPLVPQFGIADPTFRGFEPSELTAAVSMYGPPVEITNVAVRQDGPHRQLVSVAFQ
jgi:hypothetical protein